MNIVKYFYVKFWWRFVPGTIVQVRWPHGEVDSNLESNDERLRVRPLNYSADPNDHYRPWMERHVGLQHVDWDWKLHEDNISRINIKIRKGKDHWTSVIALRWS